MPCVCVCECACAHACLEVGWYSIVPIPTVMVVVSADIHSD